MEANSEHKGRTGVVSIILKLILRILPSSGQGQGGAVHSKLNREFVNQLRKFPEWLKGKLPTTIEWFNH